MKAIKILILAVTVILALPSNVQAQKDSFTYLKTGVNEREPIPWPHLREGDVKFSKRVIRVMDTREKMNYCLRWPKNPFSKLMYEWAIIPGSIGLPENTTLPAYKNDSLTSFYSTEEVLDRTRQRMVIQIPDPYDPSQLVDTEVVQEFEHDKILKYRIMEDWVFDSKHSRLYPRIIAIAPLYKPVVAGQEFAEQPIYWLKYEDLRPLFANQPTFNRFNDAAMLTLDHFFEMRMFSSIIVKESNQFDMYISEFEEFKDNGVEALLQSDKIKDKLFIIEHDLWQY